VDFKTPANAGVSGWRRKGALKNLTGGGRIANMELILTKKTLTRFRPRRGLFLFGFAGLIFGRLNKR